MEESSAKPSIPVLAPMERIIEALFGVIMALTITGAFSVAEAGKAEVNAMLLAALGCNLAWGIIDGGMYLMACLAARGHGIVVLRRLHRTSDPREGQRVIADALPPLLASVLSSSQLETMRQHLLAKRDVPRNTWLSGRDWLGALAVSLLVSLSTLPIVLPFLLTDNVRLAMRASNAMGVALLFLAGFAFGRYAGLSAWGVGLAMVGVGVVLVSLTIALGG